MKKISICLLIIIIFNIPAFLHGAESMHNLLSLTYARFIHDHPGGKEIISQAAMDSHIKLCELLTEAGSLYAKIGENEKAIEKYAEALTHYATGELYSQLGSVLYEVDSFNNAIQAYRTAGSLGYPTDTQTYFVIACAYSRMKNTPLAFEYLEIAIMNGFRDLNKIRNSNDLQFLYDQPDWRDWLNEKEKFLNRGENTIPLLAVAEYLFNGNANDNSSNRNHAQVCGATLAPDRFNQPNAAYYFNGRNNCIKVINPKGLPSGDKPKTIVAWFRYDYEWSNRARHCANIGGFGAPDTGANFQIGNGYGDVYFVWGWTGPKDWNTGVSTETTMDNKWHFVAITYDGITTTLYIDANKLASTTVYRWVTKPKEIVIGNEIDEQGHEFKGTIDDFRIYDRSLKEDEILALYHGK